MFNKTNLRTTGVHSELKQRFCLTGHNYAPYWLNYKSWINEIVVDFKHEGYTPKSRADIIKIVADKTGAHVDP